MNPLKQILKYLVFFLCVLPGVAFAIASDNQQPLHITSNSAYLDNKLGLLTYSGNVIATQGTRQLTGDKFVLNRNNTGQIDKIIVYGNPAKFRSLAQVGKPMVHGQAQTMLYQPTLHVFTLTGEAQIEQNGNISKAPIITYNTETEIINSPQNNQGRTTMIIQPISQQQ